MLSIHNLDSNYGLLTFMVSYQNSPGGKKSKIEVYLFLKYRRIYILKLEVNWYIMVEC